MGEIDIYASKSAHPLLYECHTISRPIPPQLYEGFDTVNLWGEYSTSLLCATSPLPVSHVKFPHPRTVSISARQLLSDQAGRNLVKGYRLALVVSEAIWRETSE